MENWGIPELGPGMGEALVWLLTTSDFPEASSCREVSGMRDAAAVPVQNKDEGDTQSWVASDSEPCIRCRMALELAASQGSSPLLYRAQQSWAMNSLLG